MIWAARAIGALIVLPVAAFLGYVALDALRFAARSIRDAVVAALARWRQARADDPFWESDVHRCHICRDLADDEANGILRTDFELWAAEMAEPGRRD